ncbi:hypothetical protein G4V62_08285 [Bacillaceae bacterium SIJ1]|uniref:S-layer homology domain-containing protein n=1 Tax=Litoribacterium kuwaitense TaxID=1398745 RepID=UPI0013ED3F8A|nr:S-layer homology domain-containing protein [Litoribacterium kuwaitense]NGP44956.1 hypothetical protein [Litoribacterium kuwaitense]
MKKKWLLAAGLVLATPLHAEGADDVSGHYFEVEIRDLQEAGIMNGYGHGEFRPDQQVTRAEFAAFISRALALPKGDARFSDVSNSHPLFDEVSMAASAGIVTGVDEQSFQPERPISREEIAVMIDRGVQYKDIEPEAATLTFTDRDDILYPLNVRHAVSLGIVAGNKDGRFLPKDTATRGQAATFIHRMLEAIERIEKEKQAEKERLEAEKEKEAAEQREQEAEADKEEPADPPEPKQGEFRVASFDDDGQADYSDVFTSWEEALELAEDEGAEAIYEGDKVVWISEGLAVSSGLTYIYAPSEDNKDGNGAQITYVAPGTEMKLLSPGEERVDVMLQGLDGSVNLHDVTLIPASLVKERAYYTNEDGNLVHYLYINGSYVKYLYGEAPSFINEGDKAFSWDGYTFSDDTFYQYFSFMPLRSESAYSAEELDRYVKEHKPESPLIGLGEVFKEAEDTYEVNALYLLAHAIHESNWGTSTIAREKNNLYGLRAYDVNPNENAMAFESMEANIDFAASYVSERYLTDAEGTYFNGEYLGNKKGGMNVVYASDPYWGQKIAGRMYQADKFLGGKDIDALDIIEP